MTAYPKIHSIFKRDPATRKLLPGIWALEEFGCLAETEWFFTEKIDGTNIRIIVTPGKAVTFGGRTDNAQIPARLIKRLNEYFITEELLERFPEGAVLYGEGYGDGIQKVGKLYLPNEQDFILFDIKVGPWWLLREDQEAIATDLGLNIVPSLGTGTLWDAINTVKEAPNSLITNETLPIEGLVTTTRLGLLDRAGKRITTKIKVNDFLLPR